LDHLQSVNPKLSLDYARSNTISNLPSHARRAGFKEQRVFKMLQLFLSFVLPHSTSSRQQQKIVCTRAVFEHRRKRASYSKCFYTTY
jgi:hypothetical protein